MNTDGIDRATAVRHALIDLVAAQGLHGTSMGELARHAGVATGTIYVHYADRDELILTAFAEVKRDLGLAAKVGWNPDLPPEQRFLDAWHRVYVHLAQQPERARFLLQLEASPYAKVLLEVHADVANVWFGLAEDLSGGLADGPDEGLVDVPPDVLYDLALGPAVTLAAGADMTPATEATLHAVARACWRAITR